MFFLLAGLIEGSGTLLSFLFLSSETSFPFSPGPELLGPAWWILAPAKGFALCLDPALLQGGGGRSGFPSASTFFLSSIYFNQRTRLLCAPDVFSTTTSMGEETSSLSMAPRQVQSLCRLPHLFFLIFMPC